MLNWSYVENLKHQYRNDHHFFHSDIVADGPMIVSAVCISSNIWRGLTPVVPLITTWIMGKPAILAAFTALVIASLCCHSFGYQFVQLMGTSRSTSNVGFSSKLRSTAQSTGSTFRELGGYERLLSRKNPGSEKVLKSDHSLCDFRSSIWFLLKGLCKWCPWSIILITIVQVSLSHGAAFVFDGTVTLERLVEAAAYSMDRYNILFPTMSSLTVIFKPSAEQIEFLENT